MTFKIGDKVILLNTLGSPLNEGETYEISKMGVNLQSGSDIYYIDCWAFDADCFRSLDEFEKSSRFTKHDTGKTQWNLFPWEVLQPVADILTDGAKKYSPNNWKLCEEPERYFDALMRHLMAWRGGEKTDPESGYPHLAHVMCNVLFMLWFETNNKLKD